MNNMQSEMMTYVGKVAEVAQDFDNKTPFSGTYIHKIVVDLSDGSRRTLCFKSKFQNAGHKYKSYVSNNIVLGGAFVNALKIKSGMTIVFTIPVNYPGWSMATITSDGLTSYPYSIVGDEQ